MKHRMTTNQTIVVTSRRVNASVVAIAALVLVTLTCQAWAVRRATMNPTVVVTIDLERVFEGIGEKAAEDERLVAVATELEAEAGEKQAVISDLEEELDAFPVGSDRRREVERDLQWAALDYSAFVEFSRRKMDVEKAQSLTRIYESIRESAGEMAFEHGYDMVVVDDSVTNIPQGSEADVRRQISARRIVHTNAAIDVSDELIQRMNLG
jgi:Skp family chaperone for outer membrane proteins